MRVALVVEHFGPVGGGVEHLVWNVARGLAEAGDQVHVIARSALEAPQVRLHRVRVPSFWQPLRVAAFSREAAAAARRDAFDVVHAFSRTRHQDVFHAGGGSHADYMRHAYRSTGALARRLSPRHALLLALERRIFADPGQLVQCVSQRVRDELARRFAVAPRRLAVVYPGVDLERFHPERHAAARAALRAELAADGGAVWLLAGSGWRRKGLDTALRALARARDRDAQLWVAGRDAPRSWRRLAARLGVEDRVRFLGPRSDLERVYAAADGLLLPTRYDPFGLVCLEAAASGLPVVTSARAGAAELVGETGEVIEDPENAAGFARALDRLSEGERRARLGASARRIAEAHSWRAHVARLRALYARVRS